MKLVSLNIECGLHYDLVIPFIKNENPEVICLQEVMEDDVALLEKEFGCKAVYRVRGYANSPRSRYDGVRGKIYGSAIFSKKMIKSGAAYYWGNEEKMRVSFEEYCQDIEGLTSCALLWADIKGEDGNIYTCATTHYPVSEKGEASHHQLEVLPHLLKSLESLGDFFVAGDFNAPRGRKTFDSIAAKYKDVIPEEYVTSIDQNIHRDKGIMLMVDGLFLSKKYQARNVRLVDGVSDHMAIVAEIEIGAE